MCFSKLRRRPGLSVIAAAVAICLFAVLAFEQRVIRPVVPGKFSNLYEDTYQNVVAQLRLPPSLWKTAATSLASGNLPQEEAVRHPSKKNPLLDGGSLFLEDGGQHSRSQSPQICSSQLAANILVIGDWGGSGRAPYRTRISTAVGQATGKVAESINASMVLSVGDMMYPRGAKSVDDHRFRDTFEVSLSVFECHVCCAVSFCAAP